MLRRFFSESSSKAGQKQTVMLKIEDLENREVMDATYHNLSGGAFTQNWSNAGLITTNDNWSGVPSIIGYLGDDATAGSAVDPQNVLVAYTTVDVNANQTAPNSFSTGGVTEFAITDPVVALSGSGTADFPYIQIHLNTSGVSKVQVAANLRDLDASVDNAVQAVALQYRIGTTGNFTNVSLGYVADATSGPSLATLVTPISVVLPADVANQPEVQIRFITSNAAGNDEWVGIDDIVITGDPAGSVIGSTVFFDPNENNAQNAGELGTVGVPVTLLGAGVDNEFGTGDDLTPVNKTTNSAGAYQFIGVAAGKYRVQITPATSMTAVSGSNFIELTVDGNQVYNTANFGLKSALVVNEINYDNDGSAPDANGSGSTTVDDDFVEIVNRSDSTVDLSGFVFRDGFVDRHVFPANTILAPGQALVLFSNAATYTAPDAIVQSASTGTIDLFTTGERISMVDAAGRGVFSLDFVGTATDDQSLTRNPDKSTNAFVGHLTAQSGVRSSPGKQIDGKSFFAPIASNGNATTNEDVNATGNAVAIDPNSGALTYSIVNQPTNGSVSINPSTGAYIYTPSAEFSGTDSFTFKANDGVDDSNIATITVTVNSSNDAPSFTKGADQTVNEDSGAASVSGWATAISTGPANESTQTPSFIVTTDNDALFSVLPTVAANGTLQYTPAANAFGTANISVKIKDDGGTANGGIEESAIQTFKITVDPVNDAPSFTKGADQTINEDAGPQTVTGWATAISAGSNENAQTVSFEVNTSNNSLFSTVPAVAADGTLTYTIAPNASGVATVNVKIRDDGTTANGGVDESAFQSFTITVDPVNDAPVASIPATFTTPFFTVVYLSGITLSDVDAGNDPVKVTFTSSGTIGGTFYVRDDVPSGLNGTHISYLNSNQEVVVTAPISLILTTFNNATGVSYNPQSVAEGSVVTVTMLTEDQGSTGSGNNQTDTDTSTITIYTPVAPVANNGTLTTDEDVAGTGTLSATDGNTTDVLTYSIVTQPTNGTITAFNTATGAYTYLPNANYNGTDSFTFKANDGGLDSNTATVNITVNAIDDAPTATDGTFTTNEDTTGNGTLTGGDVDLDALTFAIVAQPTNGTVTITNTATGAYTYTPNGDYNGSDSFTFKVTANGIDSNTATVNVTVNAVNDAPSFTVGGTQTVDEDAGAQTVNGFIGTFSVGPANESTQVPTFVVTNNNNPLFSVQPAIDASGNLTYTPTANASGSATVTVLIKDDGLTANGGVDESATQTFTITVNPVDDAPTATAGTLTTDEDTDGSSTLIGNDIEGDALTFEIVAQPTNGTVTITDVVTGAYTYTPAANYNGSDSFTFKVKANGLESAVTTVNITVNAIDDAPTGTNGTLTTDEDTAGTGTLAGNDVDLDALTFSIVTQPSNGTVTITNAATGAYTYTPSNNYSGSDSFTFKVTANSVDSNMATVNITVNGVNDAPVAVTGTLNATEDTQATGTLVANDVDSGSLTYSIVTQPTNGTVTITNATTGAYTYTPGANYSGSDSFTFKANDGNSDSNTATVNITIAGANDAPVIDTNLGVVLERLTSATAIPNGAAVSLFTVNVTDVDTGALKGIAITGVNSTNLQGTWEYSTNSGGNWIPFPATVSATAAIVLSGNPANRVRFVPAPKFVGFASISFKAWDETTGTSGTTGVDTSTGTAFSTGSTQAVVTVGKVTPTLDNSARPMLTNVLKGATALPAGDAVSRLLGTLATDTNKANKIGVAVTDVDVTNGVWQYQVAGKWVNITGVSDSTALLISSTTKIRFVPNAGFIGSATIQYHAWDGTFGRQGDFANASVLSALIGSAFSSTVDTAVVNVVARPVLDTSVETVLPTSGSTVVVADLLVGAVTDTLPGAEIGIAITGITGKGAWGYRTVGESGAFTPISKVSLAKALLLKDNIEIQFVADPTFTGLATLSYRAWNASVLPGVTGGFGNVANTAFSAASESLTFFRQSGTNSHPVINNATPSLPNIAEDPRTNTGVTVATITKSLGITDLNLKDKKGIAITGLTSTKGTWQYSLDGKTWLNVGTVDLDSALILDEKARVRLLTTANANGDDTLTVKAWDLTLGTSGDRNVDTTSSSAFSTTTATVKQTITPVNDPPVMPTSAVRFFTPIAIAGTTTPITVGSLVTNATDIEGASLGIAVTAASGPGVWKYSIDGVAAPIPLPKGVVTLPAAATLVFTGDAAKTGTATLSFKAWDGTSGPTGLSSAIETLTVAVGLTAPTNPGNSTLPAIDEDATVNRGETVAKLLGTTTNAKGLAISAIDTTNGTWQWSLNGTAWNTISGVSISNVLLLGPTSRVRFVPNLNFNGTATFTYHAWNQSVGLNGEFVNPSTLTTSFSTATATGTQTVRVINDPVVLNTSTTPVVTDNTTGALISAFTAGTISDVVGESSNFGIAVVGVTGKGIWQVDLLGNGSFTDLGKVSATAARLLSLSSRLRFVPASGFVGTATLTYKAWDTTGNQTGLTNTNLAANKPFFSAATETLSVTIGNTAPVLNSL